MTTNKDVELVEFIVSSTKNGTVRWEAGAGNAFIASLRGDHTVTIEHYESEPDILYLRNREGQVILQIDEGDLNSVGRLFELARRNAYDIDNVIDEIMGREPGQKPPNPKTPPDRKTPPNPRTPLSDEDIPF
jgi:hypothetical protein